MGQPEEGAVFPVNIAPNADGMSSEHRQRQAFRCQKLIEGSFMGRRNDCRQVFFPIPSEIEIASSIGFSKRNNAAFGHHVLGLQLEKPVRNARRQGQIVGPDTPSVPPGFCLCRQQSLKTGRRCFPGCYQGKALAQQLFLKKPRRS